jgi:protein CpxP
MGRPPAHGVAAETNKHNRGQMKINKLSAITALALGGLVACSTMAVAQDQKPGGGKRGPSVEARMEQMTEQLKLTDEQKPKVKAVLEDSQKQRGELRGDSNLSREDRQEKMRGIMDKESKKLKEILTADQYSKYEKMREQMRPGGKRGEKKADDSK